MDFLTIVLWFFIISESINVVILYLKPELIPGNGVGIFKEYLRSREDHHMSMFVDYLVKWVAGAKLIFIFLLVVIAHTGTNETKFFTLVALVLSISTFFFKLYPIMKTLDKEDRLVVKGYSKALFFIISGFIIIFGGALVYIFMYLK